MKNSFRINASFLLCIIFLFLLNVSSYAQDSSYEWAEMISGNLLDESFSIASDDDRNCYVTGIFNGSADIGDTTLVARGATDIFLVKYSDNNGRF